LVRLEEIDEMVRYAGPRRGVGLGGADVHASIQRHGIERENLGPQHFRQLAAGRALAARRWPREKPAGFENFPFEFHRDPIARGYRPSPSASLGEFATIT